MSAPCLRTPFLVVNPKAYLVGQQVLELALVADELAARFEVDVLFSAQHVDLRQVASATSRLVVAAQHLDPIRPGRGMGHVLPEGLVAAGARAVFLNHAEHPLTLAQLDHSLRRAEEVGLITVVCADSERQCRAVAELGPSVVLCEPTANIGTGSMDSGDYAERTTKAVKAIAPDTLVVQAAGVGSAADVRRLLALGADGSGGTSVIVQAPDQRAMLTELMAAIAGFADSGPQRSRRGN